MNNLEKLKNHKGKLKAEVEKLEKIQSHLPDWCKD